MKIAVAFAGVSYGIKNRDWRRTINGLVSNIINPLQRIGDVGVYFATYGHQFQMDLIRSLCPQDFLILPTYGSCQRMTVRHAFSIVPTNVDFVVLTRFDIVMNQPIISLCMDSGKFNFLFREKDHWNEKEFVCDCLYGFNGRYLGDVITSIDELHENPPRPMPDMHGLYGALKKRLPEESIRFVTEEHYLSSDNPFYTLDRKA